MVQAHAPVAVTSTPSGATGGRSSRRKSQQDAQAASAAHDDAVLEKHAVAMHQHAFFQVSLEQSHAYRTEATSVSHENASHAQRNKAIMKQVCSSPNHSSQSFLF